jgi:DNA adenine methylase
MGKSNRLLPWFGSNSENAQYAGSLLDGCRWVGIPFAGGMSEVPWITAKQILVNDLHAHVVNLCCVISNEDQRKWLCETADAMPYHPDVLATAQVKAAEFESRIGIGERVKSCPEAALSYFVAVWMGRGGKAGSDGELSGSLPVRWNAAGGGSNQRYRTAIEALDEWGRTFKRCEFVCMDAFDFLDKCKDTEDGGIYVDSPWPDAGDGYKHKFTEVDQCKLAGLLAGFNHARVVVRFGDHPLIRELYAVSSWKWIERSSRDQANAVKPEVYLVKNAKGE